MSVVSIASGRNPNTMVRTALDLLGGLDRFIVGESALIKPNLGPWIPQIIPKYVNQWATTKPAIVVALIKELQDIVSTISLLLMGLFLI